MIETNTKQTELNVDVPVDYKIYCIKCNTELTEETWGNGRRKAKNYICKKCDYDRVKKYISNNPKYPEQARKYYELNKERIKERAKLQYKQRANDPQFKIKAKQKYKEDFAQNRMKYLELWAKRRGRGFIPLNEEFYGSDGHHIDNEQVVFIPMFIHRKIPHRHDDSESMHVINLWVIFWLIYGAREESNMTIPKWVFL